MSGQILIQLGIAIWAVFRSAKINNDKLVGQSEIPVTIPLGVSMGEGLVVGRNAGSSMSSRYQPPFKFTGILLKVTVNVSGKMIQDTEEEMKAFTRATIAKQ